jgi:hypothetical protein
MSDPERIREREYPKRLKTTKETEDETGLSERGTTETAIPVQPGKTDPPKNSISHNMAVNEYISFTNVAGIPKMQESRPKQAHSFIVRDRERSPL